MESTAEATSTPTVNMTQFWLGKAFSLLGLALSFYVVLHLYNNTTSLSGAEAFNAHVAKSRQTPFYVPMAILALWVPIFFHGIYGLFTLKDSRPNLLRFKYFENLKYVLQRLSGIGLLAFIPAHVYKTRIEPALSGHSVDFAHMVEGFHEPLTVVVYLLGVLGAAYHVANGVWQFSIGWGLVKTQKGMNRVMAFAIVLGLALLTMGYAAMWGFYRS